MMGQFSMAYTAGRFSRRVFLAAAGVAPALWAARRRKTEVSIRGDGFLINGKPTYKGRSFNGKKVEGLLMNVRLVQAIFDDLNPETRNLWAYPDTGMWDPERNTSEFIAALGEWKRYGVLAVTLNLQGGTPGVNGVLMMRVKGESEFKEVNVTRHLVPADTEVIVNQGGGGGWGNPLERDPELVRWDVEEELISRDTARDDYGVVIREDLSVDDAGTRALRTAMGAKKAA